MATIIERLRDYLEHDEGKVNDARAEAADEIERLSARVSFLEGMVMSGQGEQIRLAADLLQEKIAHNSTKAMMEPAPTDAQVMANEKVRKLVECGDDVIRASNTLMLMLAGELPLTKPSLEAAIRRTLDARNAWDNARAALRDLEDGNG